MKTQIARQVKNDDIKKWGLTAWNMEHQAQIIFVRIYRLVPERSLLKPVSKKSLFKEVGPSQGWPLTKDVGALTSDGHKYALIFDGPDGLEVSASIRFPENNNTFDVVQLKTARRFCEAYPLEPDVSVEWRESPYVDASLANCKYMRLPFQAVLDRISKEVYYEFPDRPDRTLALIDGCAKPGFDCDGHPPGAHHGKKGNIFDGGFYTWKTNNTQLGKNRTRIWVDEKDLNSKLLMLDANRTVVDGERNVFFFRRLAHYCPESRSDIEIRLYRDWLKIDPSIPETTNINPEDPNPKHKHHTHSHNDSGRSIKCQAIL